MRDQVILARNALKNDIPLFTLVGKDKFALQTLDIIIPWQKRNAVMNSLKTLNCSQRTLGNIKRIIRLQLRCLIYKYANVQI